MNQIKIQKSKKILGKLNLNGGQKDKYSGTLTLDNCATDKGNYILYLDKKGLDEVLENAADNLEMLEHSEQKIKADIAKDVLDEVNEKRGDADLEPVSSEQFQGYLTLEGIHIFSDGSISLFYDVESNILGGHGVEISYTHKGGKEYEAEIVG